MAFSIKVILEAQVGKKNMTEDLTIRLMIVNSRAVVRSGLEAFLSTYDDFDLVGEAENGKDALRLTGVLKLDVLGLTANGLSNGEIAEKLVVSAATVKFHVSNILSRLNVSSRTEAVALALQWKLLK